MVRKGISFPSEAGPCQQCRTRTRIQYTHTAALPPETGRASPLRCTPGPGDFGRRRQRRARDTPPRPVSGPVGYLVHFPVADGGYASRAPGRKMYPVCSVEGMTPPEKTPGVFCAKHPPGLQAKDPWGLFWPLLRHWVSFVRSLAPEPGGPLTTSGIFSTEQSRRVFRSEVLNTEATPEDACTAVPRTGEPAPVPAFQAPQAETAPARSAQAPTFTFR